MVESDRRICELHETPEMTDQESLIGGCHCGVLAVKFTSARDWVDLELRACQCGFCRRHAVRTTTDPTGLLEITVTSARDLSRYAFSQNAAQFLVCRHCGVYVAAVLESHGQCVATLNTNALEPNVFGERAPVPVSYVAESRESRIDRRLRQWTPARLSVDSPDT